MAVPKLSAPAAVCGLAMLVAFSLTSFASDSVNESSSPGITIPLEVAAGTPLRLYLVKRIWFHEGAPLTARLVDPVWAFDRIVVPAGSTVQGTIVSLQPLSRLDRTRAMLGGDFTPLKRAQLSFTSLTLPTGQQMPLSALPAFGLDTIYIPKHGNSGNSLPPSSGVKGKIKQGARQQYETKRDSIIYFVRGRNKKEWIEEWLLTKLPYHPQFYRARTRVDVIISQPLEFGKATVQVDPSRGFGQLSNDQQVAEVRLLKTIGSAGASNGDPVAGVLTRPVFGNGHSLLLPVGTRFTGKVTLTQPARWFHRGGKLRFAFDHLELPLNADSTEQPREPERRSIQAQLSGVEANPSAVQVDGEGTAKATESKTRFIRPVIAGLVAARSADDDERTHSIGGTTSSSANQNLSGRALGGFSGFGIIGTAISFGPRPIGAAFGYYGFAWSVYSNIIARGKNLIFDQNTAMELQFSANIHQK